MGLSESGLPMICGIVFRSLEKLLKLPPEHIVPSVASERSLRPRSGDVYDAH